ncbi:hypothetical protein JVT61DRAFT_8355 [Boletus reticuloceps]|uniref:Uncharacterized protein n=1 Tax=Boletus reticuloceps TaxID=495285 RepID=A0A8I2Z052_9AGAM|nr:hypothetical protein JVT61DRAFT_8355 [Boletus reticuloceps]
MSNALNKLLALAVPDLSAVKKEALLTTYNDATGDLINLVKCTPDNKSELMDEQEMWIAQWEKAMGEILCNQSSRPNLVISW